MLLLHDFSLTQGHTGHVTGYPAAFYKSAEPRGTREMDWTGLKLLLEGIEPKQVRLRYKKP